MDKKQNFHSRQGSSKGVASDSRKTSDICTTSKQWPRNARRRENPNQSNSKTDPQRSTKPGSAKTRPNVDKRPRPRGGSSMSLDIATSSSGLAACNEITASGPNEYDVEFNSIYSPGSKKQNLNHLLNFHYVSRESENNTTHVFNRGIHNRNNTKKHKYNKEQFLQANFQFVVQASAEIQANIASPDVLVDWSLIEQIYIHTTEELQCPICLYPPVAAKLTRCGHAYCWACILHYLALSDRTWRKCPICYESIHPKDLKSTMILQQRNFKVGEYITMQLMCRKQGSILIEKMGTARELCVPHISAPIDEKKFSKFLLADSKEILSIIERERSELNSCGDQDCPEFIFIKQALELIKERETDILKEFRMMTKECKELDKQLDQSIGLDKDFSRNLSLIHDDYNKNKINDISETQSSETDPRLLTNDSEELCACSGNDDVKLDYFYQSAEGQNIYLHAINVKMLQSMYGSLDKSPTTIRAKIMQKETHSMDEYLRKRFRYLHHLPLTCQFEIVEIQLEPPLVSAEILQMFKEEIIQRQKQRTRRAREERKWERQINEINERQMGKLLSKSSNIDIKSPQQFPTCGFDDYLTDNSLCEAHSPSIDKAEASPNNGTNGLTFAKLLSSSKREFWPALGDGAFSSNDTANKLAWGKAVASSSSVDRSLETEYPTDLSGDRVHEMRQSFGDVIAEALHKQQIAKNKGDKDGCTDKVTSNSSNNKKNKKTKKMLLFSTGMNFGGN